MLLNHFALREDMGRLADRISKATEDSRISSGKNTMGAASAIIYMACKLLGERLTQREISNAAGTTEVTIRKRYKELQRNLAFIVTL
jgi:transcription initiation factor TFIIB